MFCQTEFSPVSIFFISFREISISEAAVRTCTNVKHSLAFCHLSLYTGLARSLAHASNWGLVVAN
jgi:hypothetical protein